MKFHTTSCARSFALLVSLGLFGTFGAGCSSGGGSDNQSFVIRNTKHAVAPGTPTLISDRWLAYLADEAVTGNTDTMETFTDLNGDGDALDLVAVVINAFTLEENVLEVAVDFGAEVLAWVDDELYLVVDEVRDARNWNESTGDMDMDDLVLLHWSREAGMGFAGLTYVDDLDRSHERKMVAVDDQLFYAADTPVAGGNMSNIRSLASDMPLVPIPILTTDPVNGLELEVADEDEGVVFLILDEDEQMTPSSLNGDLDFDDDVLYLLDGTLDAPNGMIENTGLAVPDDSGPFRAMNKAANDWLVGFFVSEAAQGGLASLNDRKDFAASWVLVQCGPTRDDEDTLDDVLHYLHFAQWMADPITNAARSTGIAGEDRILAFAGHIGTVAPEERDGEASAGGACSLNDDGDATDDVVRWVTAPESPGVAVLSPVVGQDQFRALADIPGGTEGLVEFDDHWVMVVDEADDGVNYFDPLRDLELVGWIDPSGSQDWRFSHSSGAFAGATWMREQHDGEVLVALPEEINGADFNGDMDADDSIPTVLNFALGPILQFGGVGVAIEEDNGGVGFHKGLLIYRADEMADSRDWNADGDLNDFVLLRSASSSSAISMATLNGLQRPAVAVDPTEDLPSTAAFLSDESAEGAGVDFNGDGDTNDFVVRYFVF